MEVVSVGIMYYAALVPCVISSIIASEFAANFGIHPESFHVVDIPDLTVETGLKMVLVAVACAAISIIFCMTLQGISKLYTKYFKNPIFVLLLPVRSSLRSLCFYELLITWAQATI